MAVELKVETLSFGSYQNISLPKNKKGSFGATSYLSIRMCL
jgi:hypothetical protein